MVLGLSGGSGFTGVHFVRTLERRNTPVALLSCDLTDARSVDDEIARMAPRRFLHLAGISFVGHADPRTMYEVNLLGSINLLEALGKLSSPPERIVLASSAHVYGNCPVSPIHEEAPTSPASHYAVSKLAMEQAAARYVDRLPIVIARPFNYTGPGQTTAFVIPKLVDHFRRRAPAIKLGHLHVEREFNDVRFVCDAYEGLLDRGAAGQTYNICAGKPVTLEHVIETLVQLTGHQPALELDPALVRANEVRRLCGDPGRLVQTLGPLATPTLEQTLEWMLTTAEDGDAAT